MAYKRMTVEFMARGPRSDGLSHHAALVAGFRAKLASRKSPLDSVPAEQIEQAHREFRELPEVAGEPLPAPTSKSRR